MKKKQYKRKRGRTSESEPKALDLLSKSLILSDSITNDDGSLLLSTKGPRPNIVTWYGAVMPSARMVELRAWHDCKPIHPKNNVSHIRFAFEHIRHGHTAIGGAMMIYGGRNNHPEGYVPFLNLQWRIKPIELCSLRCILYALECDGASLYLAIFHFDAYIIIFAYSIDNPKSFFQTQVL